MPSVYKCQITSNIIIAENICSLAFACKEIARCTKPGQFVHIKCGHSRLLRRPISICSVNDDEVRIVFELKGDGTKWLSQRISGESLDVLGPLGNGFTFPDGNIIVIGGGIGTPPMLYAAIEADRLGIGEVTAIIGFQNSKKIILKNDFDTVCKQVTVTTDDGSAGIHGFVTRPLEQLLSDDSSVTYSAVLSCGPHIMQKAVAEVCKRYSIPCQVSLEERMGCGVGACLVCACAVQKDNVQLMNRVCYDGPVFDANEVVW